MVAKLTAREPSARFQPIGRVLVDGGPLIALFNGADEWHARVLQWLELYPEAKLVTTWPVVTEVCTLLARRVASEAALDFLRWVQRGGLAIDRPEVGSMAELIAMRDRFAEKPFDVVEASVAEAARRLKLSHILSLETQSLVYRDRSGRPLINLLRR